MVESVDNPETKMFINCSLSSIMFNVAFSPLSNSPNKVLSLTYNSKAEVPLIVFCATLSTIAVAPDDEPTIFLFSKTYSSFLFFF